MRQIRSVFWAAAISLPLTACQTPTDSVNPIEEDSEFTVGETSSASTIERISLQYLHDQNPALLRGVDAVWAKSVRFDELGQAHTRIMQTYKNIPVFGGDAVVHVRSDGTVQSVTDKFIRDIHVNTVPRYDELEAADLAIGAVGGWGKISGEPKTDLQILRKDGQDHLTYRVQLDLTETSKPSMPVIFIDAHTGLEIDRYDNLKTSRNRLTYDARNRRTLPGTLTRSEGQGPSGDAVLDQAHDNAGYTYDFYFGRYGRDSYDDAGATLTSSVHYQNNYVNAFWNGVQMVYGDGDGSTSGPLTVLDVVAHELTHAVTDNSSDLIYQNESGALNEAMSDVFGAAVEAFRDGAVSANTWKIGEECWTPGTPGDALRYMNDPALAGDFDYYPTRYTGTSDNGGVHWNSGIANLAFYLMVNGGSHPRGKTSVVVPALSSNLMTSIQMGADIFYRANTVYLTSSSTFTDAYGATQRAALDLFGTTAGNAVAAAWDAVGVPAPASLPAPPPSYTVIDQRTNLSANKNGTLTFTYPKPSSATAMKFEINGPNGDADLYVRLNSAPTTSTYDCASLSPTSVEKCEINPASTGTYYVTIRAYSAFSGLTLTVSSGQ